VHLTYKTRMTQPVEIGARIKDARRRQGWTQDDLAVAVGVTRSAVAQWETGRAGQLTPNLTRIATVLGVGVEFLMFGEDKRGSAPTKSSDELAMLRLYRACAPDDRQFLLRTARKLSAAKMS
jgi:transcriptional regulator with XRE-family HTH domain